MANCACHMRRAGQAMPATAAAPQAVKKQVISSGLRSASPAGISRLAQKNAAMARGRPATAATFKPSTSRRPQPMRPPFARALAYFCRSFTAHSSRPVATMTVPAKPERKNSQRTNGLLNRAMCRPYSTPCVSEAAGSTSPRRSSSAPVAPSNTMEACLLDTPRVFSLNSVTRAVVSPGLLTVMRATGWPPQASLAWRTSPPRGTSGAAVPLGRPMLRALLGKTSAKKACSSPW